MTGLDRDLVAHELGHAAAYARAGAAFVVIGEDHDAGGHFAICTGLTIESSGPRPMELTEETIVAGPAFTAVLDRRFAEMPLTEKLQAGAGMVHATAGLGIAADDLADLKKLGPTRESQIAIRRYMLLAFHRRAAIEDLIEDVMAQAKAGKRITLIGNDLRQLFDGLETVWDMGALHERIWQDDYSLANIINTDPMITADATAPRMALTP